MEATKEMYERGWAFGEKAEAMWAGLINQTTDLELPCKSCKGTGQIDDQKQLCTDCMATGHIPTAFGKKILDLVHRHRASF